MFFIVEIKVRVVFHNIGRSLVRFLSLFMVVPSIPVAFYGRTVNSCREF